MSSGFYQFDDPIENFKIKIFIREILSSTTPADEKTNNSIEKEITIGWQEKIEGPREIAEKLHRATAISSSIDGNDSSRGLDKLMFYTYIDSESFDCTQPIILNYSNGPVGVSYLGVATQDLSRKFSSGDEPPKLTAAIASSVRDVFNNRERKIKERFQRNHPMKVMHICLATDVDVEALRRPPSLLEQAASGISTANPYAAHYMETVVCSISLHQDRWLEVHPALSGLLQETEAREGYLGPRTGVTAPCSDAADVSLSAFMSDSTVQAAATVGVRLQTYRLRAKSGREFEFSLQNAAEVLLPPPRADPPRAVPALSGRSDLWRQSPPAADHHRTATFHAEIVSGTSFESDELCVEYQVYLPQEWTVRTGAESSPADRTRAAGALLGRTHRCSARSLSRRPREPLPPGARAFLGAGLCLLTVLAVLLGAEYLIWLLVAVLHFLLHGLGHRSSRPLSSPPIGGRHRPHAPPYQFRSPDPGMDNEPISVFGHLFSWSCDVKDVPIEQRLNAASAYSPTVLFQVYGVGPLGALRSEGYGCVVLPDSPGAHRWQVKIWQPQGGILSSMREFFLGFSLRLEDKAYVHIPDRSNRVLNRVGVCSRQTGSLSFRCHIASADLRQPQSPQGEPQQAAAANTVRRTAQDILQSFRTSVGLSKSMMGMSLSSPGSAALLGLGRRLASSVALPSGPSTPMASRPASRRPSFSSTNAMSLITDSLNTSNRMDTLADVLARAKAKTAKLISGKAAATADTSVAGILLTTPPRPRAVMSPLQQAAQQESEPLLSVSRPATAGVGEASPRRYRSQAEEEDEEELLLGDLL